MFLAAVISMRNRGHYVPHQARHTLATNLLRHGATLTHIRRYLGQVSDRLAEHYVNSRELHQVGEKPQGASSWRRRDALEACYRPAA
jgi:site-specific recombinase XerD